MSSKTMGGGMIGGSSNNQRGFSPNKAMWKASVAATTLPVNSNQFSIPASHGHGNQGFRGMQVGGIQGSTYPRTKISQLNEKD